MSKTSKNEQATVENKEQTTVENQIPPMPEVRVVPIWSPDAVIEITGAEWHAIQEGLSLIQGSMQAAQAVMAKNIVKGVIDLDCEKLNPKTLSYEPMTADEKEPHLKTLKEQITAAATQASNQG